MSQNYFSSLRWFDLSPIPKKESAYFDAAQYTASPKERGAKMSNPMICTGRIVFALGWTEGATRNGNAG
jgi:hypothetical protein